MPLTFRKANGLMEMEKGHHFREFTKLVKSKI